MYCLSFSIAERKLKLLMDCGSDPIFKRLLTAIYRPTAGVWDNPVTVKGEIKKSTRDIVWQKLEFFIIR